MKTHKFLLNAILGIMVLLTTFVRDQAKAQAVTNYDTTTSGLLDNYITAITFDNQGNKWFGTISENGRTALSKFDGTTWITYPIFEGTVANYISEIVVDKAGNLWVGTNLGALKFDGTTWTNFTNEDGLPNNEVTTIAIDDQDNKWFGTTQGVSKFDGTTWKTYNTRDGLANNLIYSISIDAQDNKWFGTARGVSKFDGTTWINYLMDEGSTQNYIVDMAIDSKDNKWFGIDQIGGGAISEFDGTTWRTHVNYSLGYVMSIAVDTLDNLWVVATGGVLKFDGSTWTNYTADGFFKVGATTIAIDKEGDIWVGSMTGISKLSFKNTPTQPVYPESLLTLYPNPVQDVLHLNFKVKTATLEVFDVTGKSLLHRQIIQDHSSMDVSFLKNGIYFVKVFSGNQLVTGKFVKQ